MDQVAAPDLQLGVLEMGLLGAGGILFLVALVCGILVIVKMFQNQQAVLGVISLVLMFCSGIGHLIALIFGWVKSTEWNIKGLMLAYTFSIIGMIVLGGAGYAIMLPKLIKAAQEQTLEQTLQIEQEFGEDVSFEELVEPIEIGQ